MTVNFWTRYLPVMAAVLLMTFVQLWEGAAVKLPRERLDGLIYDLKVKRLAPWPTSLANVQIVDIDEYSLATVGRMPWSRDKFAQLTSILSQQGALVIVYDILFAEPQLNPALAVVDALDNAISLNESKKSDIYQAFDYDMKFASSMDSSDVVLPMLLHRSRNSRDGKALRVGQITTSGVTQNLPDAHTFLHSYPGYAASIPLLAQRAAGQGFMNSFEDADGFVRRVALLAQVEQKLVPSLALEAFRVYSLADSVQGIWEVNQDNAYMTGVMVGNQRIATDDLGQILIPYRGTIQTYPYTSAADVLTNKVADNRFEQAVVFIGTSATGLADLRATPMALGFPGVEIQATVFDALMNPQHIPSRPEWWREALLLQLLSIGLIAVWLLSNRSPWLTLVFTLGIVATVIGLNLWFWYGFNLSLPLISPLLLAAILGSYFIGNGFFNENRKRRKVKAVFDQYVPPAHIDRLLNSPDSVSLSGEKKELSVMFSDIRSFTTISESMNASELKLWLNQFFSPITQAILSNDGTIDKYVGDMVMAFWGAPLEEPKHAEKSIDAAFAMLSALETLNQQFETQQQPLANIGIGINTGEMNVGDMGSDFRRAYTVIGDAVNLGSRLEGLTKFYGVDILLSESTASQASSYQYWLIDKVKVKGKALPVTVFSPLSKQASQKEFADKDAFNAMMADYFAARFDAALSQISQLEQGSFTNPHLLSLYRQRIGHLMANPPAEDWDGSYTHTSK